MDTQSLSWPAEAENLLDDLVDLRRAIHREPELGLQNPKTLAKIKDALAGLPLDQALQPFRMCEQEKLGSDLLTVYEARNTH